MIFRPKRSWSAVLCGLALAAAGCSSTIETPLEPIADLDGRSSGALGGQAARARHPPGVAIRVAMSHVTDRNPEAREHIDVAVEADNRSGAALVFDPERWRLFDDGGGRFPPEFFVRWNPDRELYENAPAEVAPGRRERFLARFTLPQGYRLEHVIEFRLLWTYRHQGKRYPVVSRFRVR